MRRDKLLYQFTIATGIRTNTNLSPWNWVCYFPSLLEWRPCWEHHALGRCLGASPKHPGKDSRCTLCQSGFCHWWRQQWLVVCLVWPVRSWLPHLSSVLWSGFIRQGGKVARKLEVWTNVQRLNSCFDTFFWCNFCQTVENVVWQTFKSQVIFTPEILPDDIHGSVSGIWCFWRSAVFV